MGTHGSLGIGSEKEEKFLSSIHLSFPTDPFFLVDDCGATPTMIRQLICNGNDWQARQDFISRSC